VKSLLHAFSLRLFWRSVVQFAAISISGGVGVGYSVTNRNFCLIWFLKGKKKKKEKNKTQR